MVVKLADAEVDNLEFVVRENQNIRRTEITMDDSSLRLNADCVDELCKEGHCREWACRERILG